MKSADVTRSICLEFNKENNNSGPKFKVGYHVRTSKYKNAFTKFCIINWSEEDFMIKNVKNTVPWTINDLNGKEILGIFFWKQLLKTHQKEFRVEKVIKRKYNKLYVKWKGYDSSFNSWIDKKQISIFQNQNLFEEEWNVN